MIVSYNWLKELVKLNVSAEKLAEEMSLYSVEVESFKKLIDATNLVVGLVTSKKKHENSECGKESVAAFSYRWETAGFEKPAGRRTDAGTG